jgi:hypothetical protein
MYFNGHWGMTKSHKGTGRGSKRKVEEHGTLKRKFKKQGRWIGRITIVLLLTQNGVSLCVVEILLK